MYDFIIKNARIIDGTSAPWFRGSVAVKDGKIAEIGPAHGKLMQDAAEVVDGQDLYLAPGFIDMHSHSDTALPKYPLAESRIIAIMHRDGKVLSTEYEDNDAIVEAILPHEFAARLESYKI